MHNSLSLCDIACRGINDNISKLIKNVRPLQIQTALPKCTIPTSCAIFSTVLPMVTSIYESIDVHITLTIICLCTCHVFGSHQKKCHHYNQPIHWFSQILTTSEPFVHKSQDTITKPTIITYTQKHCHSRQWSILSSLLMHGCDGGDDQSISSLGICSVLSDGADLFSLLSDSN